MLHGAEGVDFDSWPSAYAIVDKDGDLTLVQHDAIQSLQITKETNGTDN